MKKILLLALFATFTSGCDSKVKLKPLNDHELDKLTQLKTEYEHKRKLVDIYNNEKERIKNLSAIYAEQSLDLSAIKIRKSSSFSDGLTRACRTGVVKNNGEEIIDEIKVRFTFNSEDHKGTIKEWETSLISANDDFINNKKVDDKTKALIVGLSGVIYPIKPNSSYKLPSDNACLSDSFVGWSPENVNMEIVSVKLRPKMEEHSMLDLLNMNVEIGSLEQRAKENNQI